MSHHEDVTAKSCAALCWIKKASTMKCLQDCTGILFEKQRPNWSELHTFWIFLINMCIINPSQVLLRHWHHLYLSMFWKRQVEVWPSSNWYSVSLPGPVVHRSEDSSFATSHETIKAVRKEWWDLDQCLSRILIDPIHDFMLTPKINMNFFRGLVATTAQELAFHGVEMSGPARRLEKAGHNGVWKQNFSRDMIRQVGRVVTWLELVWEYLRTYDVYLTLMIHCVMLQWKSSPWIGAQVPVTMVEVPVSAKSGRKTMKILH